MADLSSLPVEFSLAHARAQIIVMLVFGLVWVGITAGIVFPNIIGEVETEPILWIFFTLFPLIGFGLIFYAMYLLSIHRTVNISRTQIRFSEKSIFGHRAWQEPLSGYQGIRHRTRVIRSKNSSTTYQIVELAHLNQARIIPLFVQPGMATPRQKLEEYAAALQVPVMGSASGQAARHVDDLDKSIRELSSDGKFDNRFDPNSPVPRGLKISTSGSGDDAELEITILAARIPRALKFAMIVIPILISGVAAFGNNHLLPLLIGAGILVIAVMAIRRDNRTPRLVRLTRNTITGEAGMGRQTSSPRTLPFNSIEEIYVRRDANGRGRSLVVAGDQATLKIGTGLPAKSLEWLRGYIAAAILTA